MAAERLTEFPRTGHTGRVAGTYEWVVRGLPYIIVYQVRDDGREVVVLSIVHGARDREGEAR